MNDLLSKKCEACEGGVDALNPSQISELLNQIDSWSVIDNHHLSKEFEFPNFVLALAFVNDVGTVAEEEGHHPNIFLTWGKVGIEIWTHSINGLTENDFILAAKVDELL